MCRAVGGATSEKPGGRGGPARWARRRGGSRPIVRIPISWRRRASRASSSRAARRAAAARGPDPPGEPGRGPAASIASVLARRPRALAKSRAWRGLITATGSPAAAAACDGRYPELAGGLQDHEPPAGAARAGRPGRPHRSVLSTANGARPSAAYVEGALDTSMPRNTSGAADRIGVDSRGLGGPGSAPPLRIRPRAAAASVSPGSSPGPAGRGGKRPRLSRGLRRPEG